jgi:hypothetical protein
MNDIADRLRQRTFDFPGQISQDRVREPEKKKRDARRNGASR